MLLVINLRYVVRVIYIYIYWFVLFLYWIRGSNDSGEANIAITFLRLCLLRVENLRLESVVTGKNVKRR